MLAFGAGNRQTSRVRTSIDLDPELEQELEHAASLTREKPATLIRLALRVGLPVVCDRFQAPRPAGYFSEDYRKANPERLRLERAMAKAKQRPER
jgi:hypothetical protein